RSIGLGLVQFFTFFLVVLLSGGLIYILAGLFELTGAIIGVGVGLLLLLLVGLIFNVANMIFNTALYVYATSNIVANGFDEEVVRGAFKAREK
ncbi:MAG: hypothetical protein RIA63_03605, partial [Cyclobacteriaceae bacterium]